MPFGIPVWYSVGRELELAPTEEGVAFGQPIYEIMSYHYLEMVLLLLRHSTSVIYNMSLLT